MVQPINGSYRIICCFIGICSGTYLIKDGKYYFNDGYLQNPFFSTEPALKFINGNYLYVDNNQIHNANGPAIRIRNRKYYYYRGVSITESKLEQIKSYKQLFNKIIEELRYLTD